MTVSDEIAEMRANIESRIATEYRPADRGIVASRLAQLTTEHVMANSEWNLLSARFAILTLAEGKLDEILPLVEAAKSDFRDVIYWATLARQE